MSPPFAGQQSGTHAPADISARYIGAAKLGLGRADPAGAHLALRAVLVLRQKPTINLRDHLRGDLIRGTRTRLERDALADRNFIVSHNLIHFARGFVFAESIYPKRGMPQVSLSEDQNCL